MKIKDIVIIGMLSSVLLAAQVILAPVANVELVTLLIILYTLFFRKKTIYIISVFILLEGFLYGFGLWWINYLYIWFLLFLLVMIMRKNKSPMIWAIISGSYGLAFGALCAIPYFIIGFVGDSFSGGIHMAFAYWISGIPFDVTHGISNFVLMLILYKPLYGILSKLSNQNNVVLTE